MDQLINTLEVPPCATRLDQITAIWQQILERETIPADADFFDLGGNSMLLLAMLECVQEQLQCEIAIDDLAEGVTTARIASLIS
jgi:acyl carrier protein